MDDIQHLLNLDTQRIVCVGGLMGAGKSTLAEKFEQVGYIIVSPDIERLILARKDHGEDKYESELVNVLESYSKQAWINAEQKVIEELQKGNSVFFDATLATVKARRQLLSWASRTKTPLIMIYLDVPLETAQERNEKRGYTQIAVKNDEPIFGRLVPAHVIELKNRYQVLPLIDEGFKEVVIISQELKRLNGRPVFENILDDLIKDPRKTIIDLKQNHALKGVFPHLDDCWGISQDNKHHNRTLDEHMITAAEVLVDKFGSILNEHELKLLTITTLNHDVGKKDTKQFFGKMITNYEGLEENESVIVLDKNQIGVIVQKKPHLGFYKTIVPYNAITLDTNAHYYEHERVGALKMYRNMLEIGYDKYFATDIYALILHHMLLPYQVTSNKSMSKFIRTVGKDSFGRERAKHLLYIRYADKMAGNTASDFEEVHNQMMEQIEELLKKGKRY